MAAFDLSLASETNFADPAVSALTFSIKLFFFIKAEHWLNPCAWE